MLLLRSGIDYCIGLKEREHSFLNSKEVVDIDNVSTKCESDFKCGDKFHTKTHLDGWTITGYVKCSDYNIWIDEFEAVHEKYGRIEGYASTIIIVSSLEGFQDFIKHHPFDIVYI